MKAYIQSELLKMRHTFVQKVIWIAPIITILLSFVLSPFYYSIDSFNWWYSVILPGLLSLGCTLVAQKDKKMKQMAVLLLPVDRKKVWIGKIIVCIRMLMLSSMVYIIGYLLLLEITRVKQSQEISIISGVIAVIVLVLTFMWQIPLCLYLGSKLGMFPTILINLSGYLILGNLFSTHRTLWFLPYSLPGRLMCPILKVLPNGLPAKKGSLSFYPQLLSIDVLVPGILMAIFLFIMMMIVTSVWYQRQEAK